MRTLQQRLHAARTRVAEQLALAVQQQQFAARFAEMARLAYACGDLYAATAYQREAAERRTRAQQHLDTAAKV